MPRFTCLPSRRTPIGTQWGRIYGLSKSDHDLLLPAYCHLHESNTIAVSMQYNPQQRISANYTLFDEKMLTSKQAICQRRRNRRNVNRHAPRNIDDNDDDTLDNENDDTDDEDDTEVVDAADDSSVNSVLHFPWDNHGNWVPTWILGNNDNDNDCFIGNWKIMETNDENNDNQADDINNEDGLRMIGTRTPLYRNGNT
jgi:hypothetical protein